MEVVDKIKDRIMKLLILASDNKNETETFNALAKARQLKELFPEFNYHKHYHDKLYKCHKCNEKVTIDSICYISVEMFEAEYYFCRNCTSNKMPCMENINERI